MKKQAGQVFSGLGWVALAGCLIFMTWYSGASVRTYLLEGSGLGRIIVVVGREMTLPAKGGDLDPSLQVLDRGDCLALEEYLRDQGHRVRVFCGTREDTGRGVAVQMQVQLPDGRLVTWPEFFGPVDNSRTLGGLWPCEEGVRGQGSGARGENQ